jgi:hypothetical protein
MPSRKRNKRKLSMGAKHTDSEGKRTAKVRNRADKNCHTRNPKPILIHRGD